VSAAVAVILGAVFAPLIACWAVWLAAAVAAALPRRRAATAPAVALAPVDVLVPAHDEAAALPALLDALAAEREAIRRVLVVADHCTDDTAAIAAGRGAGVLVRDDGPRGKPAALRAGLAALRSSAERGAGILILDADCVPSPGYVARMAERLAAGDAVVQSAYRMRDGADLDAAGAAVGLGVALKNVIRPTGLARLGLPCQLLGTGMIFRRDVLDRVTFADDLVEDVRMSHALLRAGVHPRFLPDAEIVSTLPPDREGLTQQRMRWEGGQLRALWSGLRLAASRALRGDLRSALSLLDWSAPPLALGTATWALGTVATTVLVGLGVTTPWALAVPAATAALLGAYLVVGLAAVGGRSAVLRLAVTAPRFLAWKVGIYLRLASGEGPRGWARTPRASAVRGEVNGP
jgi:cellulose synthase/poly-beta-1,6-N-acetylglucosamine synthase-like glycosyltransferase